MEREPRIVGVVRAVRRALGADRTTQALLPAIFVRPNTIAAAASLVSTRVLRLARLEPRQLVSHDPHAATIIHQPHTPRAKKSIVRGSGHDADTVPGPIRPPFGHHLVLKPIDFFFFFLKNTAPTDFSLFPLQGPFQF